MEHLLKFTIDKKTANLAKQQNNIWIQECYNRKVEFASKFPIIQTLDSSLQEFHSSIYDDDFKKGISCFIDKASKHLYSGNFHLSEQDINAFIKNFEWYNSIISMFVTLQNLLQNEMFSLCNPVDNKQKISPVKADIDLVTEILDLCNKIFGQNIRDLEIYKKRLASYKKMRQSYDKFMKSSGKYAKSVPSTGLDHVGYLMGVEIGLENLMNKFEDDINKTKPILPEVFTNKRKNTEKALTGAVIKMVHSYMETHYRLKDEKSGRTKMVIWKYHNLLSIIANTLLGILKNKKTDYYNENRIKGLLKKQ